MSLLHDKTFPLLPFGPGVSLKVAASTACSPVYLSTSLPQLAYVYVIPMRLLLEIMIQKSSQKLTVTWMFFGVFPPGHPNSIN
jgi:hypothetical protein